MYDVLCAYGGHWGWQCGGGQTDFQDNLKAPLAIRRKKANTTENAVADDDH
jgi:hypothetical protein